MSSSTPGSGERTTSLPRDSDRRDAHGPARDREQPLCHASAVCVVHGIQLRIPWCEEDNLDAVGEFIGTAAVGHLPEKPLGEKNDDMLARLSPV